MDNRATIMTETAKIRALARPKPEPDAEIIAVLEQALELARSGEMTDLVIVYGTAESYDYDYRINSDAFAIAGYMSRVTREIEDIDFDE